MLDRWLGGWMGGWVGRLVERCCYRSMCLFFFVGSSSQKIQDIYLQPVCPPVLGSFTPSKRRSFQFSNQDGVLLDFPTKITRHPVECIVSWCSVSFGYPQLSSAYTSIFKNTSKMWKGSSKKLPGHQEHRSSAVQTSEVALFRRCVVYQTSGAESAGWWGKMSGEWPWQLRKHTKFRCFLGTQKR